MEYCNFCLEFYRKKNPRGWGSSNRIVKIPGCSSCQERHEKAHQKMVSLQLDFDEKTKYYEADLANLKAKSSLDLLEQRAEYEKVMLKFKHNLTIEVKNLRADINSQQSKLEFLRGRRNSFPGDVTLVAPGLQISTHCTILAAKSPVFQKMLQSAIIDKVNKESATMVINIDGVSSPILEAIVDFCYSGEITFSGLVPPHEVLKAAHIFEISFLKELCEAELCRGLSVDNVPQMLKLSRKFAASRLQEEAGKMFKEHFDILNSKVYEVLEGAHSALSIPESSPEICQKLDV